MKKEQTQQGKESREREFAALVREHKQTIYTVCYMFSQDEDEVADLFQDTLVNLWQGLDSFRHESKPETWIYRVALNTCVSADRKKKSALQRVELSMQQNLYRDNSHSAQQIRQLHDRIQKLDVIDRAIILLWLEDLSYEEIAAIVGISVKNLSVKLVRIKEQLKNI
ncbi:MAG: sigma-70 family RNA polymerase sigma factor [Paludibacteraceae bacterium]|nr:sigma-70 family RNA polymerase sigma factor [Paludibacteraceae bacterium]